MPMVAPDLVAPSMGTYGMPPGFAGSPASVDDGYGQVQHGLRAYSPMVPFAAAAAAEVVAGTIGLARDSGFASVAGAAGRSPILSALAVVAPSAISPARSALPVQVHAQAQPSTASPTTSPPTPSSTRALIDAARAAVTRIEDARHAPAPAQPGIDSVVEPATAPGQPPVVDPAVASVGVEPSAASASERAVADAATTSPQIARALRTVDLLLSASSPSPSTVAATAADPGPASTFAPAVGPRVTMPAGLGGLVTALDARHTTTHPMVRVGGMPAPLPPALAASARALEMPLARAAMPRVPGAPAAADADVAAPATRDVPGFAPVWARPATAIGSIAADRARAVDHVAWSDRWLARFVGASPLALASLDVAFDHGPAAIAGAPRTLDVAAPEMSYLRPPMPASALAAAIRASAQVQPLDARAEARAAAPATPRVAASPDRALRIDDNEAVSDDIFAAIAAAAVAPSRARPAARDEGVRPTDRVAPEPGILTPADVVRAGSRPTIADLVSIAPPPAPGAGLAPGLASSPMAPAMAAMLPLPAAPVFDARSLYPDTLGSAYLGGLLTRSAATVGVVSAAPTLSALVAAAGAAASAEAAFPVSAALAGAPSALPYVGLERVSRAMGDARAWTTRDLAIAPSSLRLAEAAPERVVLAADQARRATMIQRAEAARVAPAAPSLPMPVGADAPSPDERAPAAIDAPTAAPAPPASAPPASALDHDLVGLRAALLAGGATSVPLAFAEYLPMLSAAMAAPLGATAPDDVAPSLSLPATTPAVTGAAPSVGTAAAAELSLPFVTSAAQGVLGTPAGSRGLALPAVGGHTTAPGARMSRLGVETLDAGDAGTDAGDVARAAPALPGMLGARDALASLVSLHAPVAATSTGRPGSLAEMILSWSVAEERAVTDLSFDFVAPEMVLAAKVYGLSPGAAAQAARLAVAGPGAIASLATSVDLTFLRGFQQAQAQQGQGMTSASAVQRATAPGTAAPAFAPDGTPLDVTGSAAAPSFVPAAAAAPSYAGGEEAATSGAPPMPSLAGSVLSSPRLPRGAFLWPEATVAALGLRALSPEGVAGMPVVALELLAAAAVADLGTWVTAFPSADQSTIANVIRGLGGTVPTTMATTPGGLPLPSFATAPAGAPSATASIAGAPPSTVDGEVPDLDAIPALGGAPRDLRARFESIYVALARTGDGQNLSPSARAARAMALLAREDGGTTSARERALAAWSMLPNVYQGGMDVVAPRDGVADDSPVESRPGLAALAARAGESLGSFVAPSAREVSSWGADDRGTSALAARAELPVYVDTSSSSSQSSSSRSSMSRPGRTFAQAGGGEPEIPAWFEAAARRMLDDRSPGAGMSLAELVLVTSAATPSKAIAASTRGSSPTAVASTPSTAAQSAGGQKPNVEKLAYDVFQEVLRLIDIARERGGDPYQ